MSDVDVLSTAGQSYRRGAGALWDCDQRPHTDGTSNYGMNSLTNAT